ncbi:autotransporter outer membrane beta-barrel domain-containing protein [Candidatus Pelagibacter giovannonii]|uniref:Autotransporter outer membrane beta-barrel domain-containing protein n=1 Tax=Candidatus Pelagibacter giovannonii TaxID=2563896 RepID=A0A6H1Q351_9PROT|nr:autotransporter outer membrane beta-barrel domain-containing protein [Candidatus Pelagibacter giovannonii]QIZ21357.1 autotransporter outer membrane beta-barrel domain-containing protein [Candidatus Pelagibacter giovannonii]
MKFIKNFILILLFIFPISNSFGAMHTYVQKASVAEDGDHIQGIEFNVEGTKMFILYRQDILDDNKFDTLINSYNLSRPFDVSSRVYAGDSERCIITEVGDDGPEPKQGQYDLEFSSDGKSFFFVSSQNGQDANGIFKYNLTSPYDVGSCQFAQQNKTLGENDMQNGSNAGDMVGAINKNRPQGVEIGDDGTKIFIIQMGHGNSGSDVINTRLLEYELSTPFDLDTMSLVTTGGIELEDECSNPMGIRLSSNGKRLWCVDHLNASSKIVQISLDVAFSTSSFTIDGTLNIANEGGTENLDQPRGIAFSRNGLKMYIGGDRTIDATLGDVVNEFDLVCPFNIIEGKCPSITTGDRTGIAIAQIEVATRTIEHSTDTALNRLKWIRRNKDNQNLTNLNLNLNFTNQMLASLTKVVKTSATTKKKEEKQQDVFYWSEGSIVVGRVGDTNVSSFKRIKTDAITVGVDKFTKNNGISGLAFRFGKNDIDVGSAGSNLDTNTYNLTHYSSSPIEDDTKFIDTVFGVGVLNSDILSVLDGKRVTADRKGRQIYGTIKLKDEIKKNNLILVPSVQIDLGYTLLNDYQESGNTAMKFKKQGIQSRNARLSIAAVDELENNKYKIRKHGKLEYKANLHRSSNIKYSYVSDASSGEFDTKLNSGALHNLNGELGIDIILPDSFSIFLIYERNQALGTSHTDKIHLAIGYLPNKKTNYAFKLVGSENLGSEFKISKNINDFEIDFKLNNQDALKPNTFDEATINLKKIF